MSDADLRAAEDAAIRDAVTVQRIDEASRYVPLEQLCLSPQCGCSSTVEGNALSHDQQRAKLDLIVEVAADGGAERPPRSGPADRVAPGGSVGRGGRRASRRFAVGALRSLGSGHRPAWERCP